LHKSLAPDFDERPGLGRPNSPRSLASASRRCAASIRARAGVGVHWLGEGADMTKEKPFSATFKLEKETKNMCYAEEAEGRRPVVGTVYIDKYELGQPYPERIRVNIERV
jgi:hypothetical protein